jgi:uncharacterized protein (TIGR00255 family)
MLRSMTGYGKGAVSTENRDITVELRSVNHRYFDCSVRLPRAYISLEETVRGVVQGSVPRGKIEAVVTVDHKAETAVELNQEAAGAYLKAAKELVEIYAGYGLRNDLTVSNLLRLPEVFTLVKPEEDAEAFKQDVIAAAMEAAANHTAMRVAEGRRLADDIAERLDVLDQLVMQAEARSPQTVSEYRAKLEKRMRDVLENIQIEESRLITEAALFADKIANAEEIVRLRSHMQQMRSMLQSKDAVGKKLDFLMQEMGREINTLGSKGNDAVMAQLTVDMKAEAEKIREQIQNIE